MSRLDLHRHLTNVCDHVYFQPGTNVQMVYPCIVYNLSGENRFFANDKAYLRARQYDVTIIDKDPDSIVTTKLESELPTISLVTAMVTEGLNHFVYSIYDSL